MFKARSLSLLFAFLAIAAVSSSSKILLGNAEVKRVYDYVIVGGGTSGLTVADRLTEDGKCKMSYQLKISVNSAKASFS